MINRSSILSTLALLLATGVSMAQVTVSTKLPATVPPGGSFTLELDVAKGDVSGFAKLQQQLPPGFTAEEGQTSNATFSFKDQKVKFLWMALPNGDFKVSYKVNVDASLSGNQIIEGTFAYIKDNETEKFIIPKDIIAVQANQAEAAQDAAMQQILADQKAKEEAANAAREDASRTEEPVAAKTEEAVEEVAAATEEVVDNSAAEAEAKAAEAEKARVAAEKKKADDAEKARKAEEKRQAEQAKEAEKASAQPVEKTAPADYNDAMMATKAGLVFRVQVAAGPNKVDPAFFQSKYGINDPIVIEEHEGLFKYVVGEFGSYRPAKTFSNELRDNSGVEGPFVTAYSDGARIHVKQALKMAGQ